MNATPPTDPLPPPYSPRAGQERDSDTVSIVSQAPSYTSHTTELPAYENIRPLGLPRLEYAPGFTPGNHGPFSAANYTMSSSAELSSPTRRQYENVVNRRAALRSSPEALVDDLLGVIEEGATTNNANSESESSESQRAVPLNSLPIGAGSITAQSNRELLLGYCPYVAPPPSFSTTLQQQQCSAPALTPAGHTLLAVNPHEDPELVGHAAAEQARSQRLYREGLLREMAAQKLQRRAEEAAVLNGMDGPLSYLGQQRGLLGWRSGPMRGTAMRGAGRRPRMFLVRRLVLRSGSS